MLPNFRLCKFTKSQLVATIIQNLNLPLNITSCIACIQFGIYIKKNESYQNSWTFDKLTNDYTMIK
jgi:hypothetical protein